MGAIVTLPLTYQLSNGSTADASQVMADLNQIATNVNANAFSRDGTNPPTAATPWNNQQITSLGGISMTGAINNAPEVTLASAATVAIGAAAANNIIITGTTAITAFDTVADGIVREVVFSGALTLTYNAASMILPGSGNITTAAGDCATFLSLGSGNWRCLKYYRASIAPSVEGSALLTAVCTSGTITLGNKTISYAKIGSMVFFTGVIDVSAVSSPTGSISLSGLPYTSGNNNRNYAAVSVRISGGTQNVSGNVWQAYIPSNSSSISISYYNPSTGTEGSSPAAQVMANTSFTLSGMYMVN